MKNRLRLYKFVIFILVIVFIVSGAFFVKDFVVAASTNHVVKKSEDQSIDPFSILIIGTDGDRAEDGSEGARSDVLMVATFDPKNERDNMEVNVVSIPRDTVAYITCGGYYDKINAAYSVGLAQNNSQQEAIDCAVDTVENLLNIPIDYYMEISFNGVIALIDAIGGIEINSPRSFCEQDSNGNGSYSSDIENCEEGSIIIYEGPQNMNGEEALAYSRSRYDSSTYSRDMRQQEVIAATIKKIMSDPVAYLKPALEVYNEYVTTNLDISTLTDFATIAVTVFNASMRTLDSTTPIVVDIVSSPFANATEVESALSAFSGINLENMEAKPISEVFDTYDEYEQYSEVKQIYVSKKATPIPTVSTENLETEVEPFEVEVQTMSILSMDMSTPNGYYSYIDYDTLYYVSNTLRTSLGLEVEEPTFNYEEASAVFGWDMTVTLSDMYAYYY